MDKAKPIIFSTPMIRAILEGKKTQTRRVIDKDISNKFDIENDGKTVIAWTHPDTGDHFEPTCPAKYKVGDVLWVRETWAKKHPMMCEDTSFLYKADNEDYSDWKSEKGESFAWRPSIYMPREAARLFIKVTGVRVERINEITEEDAKAEGADIDWLKGWIEENYWEPDDNQHWVYDRFNGHDQSISYCKECGDKEISKRKRLAKREGATEKEIDDIFLDGGWGIQENDIPTRCEECGKALTFGALRGCLEYEHDHYLEYGFSKDDAYLLEQLIDDDELKEMESFHKICFRTIWDSIYAKRGYSWESNPWVFCYSFERVEV